MNAFLVCTVLRAPHHMVPLVKDPDSTIPHTKTTPKPSNSFLRIINNHREL